MNVLGSIPFRVRAALDRDLMVWAVGPALGAILVTTLFVIPNYVRALRMQDEAQRLEAVSGENISQRNNLKLMERSVSELREECNRRCRPLAEGTDRDHLLSAITRPTDGAVVREQSIRTSVLAPVDAAYERRYAEAWDEYKRVHNQARAALARVRTAFTLPGSGE